MLPFDSPGTKEVPRCFSLIKIHHGHMKVKVGGGKIKEKHNSLPRCHCAFLPLPSRVNYSPSVKLLNIYFLKPLFQMGLEPISLPFRAVPLPIGLLVAFSFKYQQHTKDFLKEPICLCLRISLRSRSVFLSFSVLEQFSANQ